ncbi:MAG TPA: MarR family transcriptional regulator [Anaerolineae bacterium]|nr:MarR family transcriptional regulator [Anaerolineae bacterium]
MTTRRERIINLLKEQPGLTDRQITDIIDGPNKPQQPVNFINHRLVNKNIILRQKRSDGLIGNYLTELSSEKHISTYHSSLSIKNSSIGKSLSEDGIKEHLQKWLSNQNWRLKIAWGNARGIDIEAQKENELWVIEVKGEGSRTQMNANFFLSVLGEILQRMNDPNTKYSISLPDIPQFQGLWKRLPYEAKKRLGISVLFINNQGEVREVNA